MKVVCEFSGGADSTLAALLAKVKYPEAEFHQLFVDYGQVYCGQEMGASLALAKRLFPNTNWKLVQVGELYNRYLPNSKDVNEYFPLRNMVIAAISGAYAAEIEAEVIITGSKSFSKNNFDSYSFNDSTLAFYKVMEAAINAGLERGRIRIEPILAEGREIKMSKYAVYKELLTFGVRSQEIWNCYHPLPSGKACGTCKNCEEKKIVGI